MGSVPQEQGFGRRSPPCAAFHLAKQFGYRRIGKKELGNICLWWFVLFAASAPASALCGKRKGAGVGVPHKGPPRGCHRVERSRDLCSIPGDTVFTGRHPPELRLCRCHWGEPRCAWEGFPHPTRSRRSVLQLCRGFSCIWVKFLLRLESSRVLEHAGCRCHSWVIQEINWGLGWEAASKWTLCSDLPPAPAQS